MGAAALALAALEVAVRGGGAALPRFQLVRVHAQAHGAAGEAPLGAEVLEDLVQALGLGLEADAGGAGHHQHPDVGVLGRGPRMMSAAARRSSIRELVQEPRKTVSTRMSFIGVPASRPMYCSARSAAALAFSSPKSSGDGTLADRDTPWPGLVPHVTNGSSVSASRSTSASNVASSSVAQGVPVLDGGVPVGALRRVRAAVHVVVGGLVRGDDAGAGAGLDGHVADGHPGFHGQRPDRGAAVLKHVALAAAGADLGDDGQDDVLGGHARLQGALDVDGHGLERLQGQRLGGHDVLHLGGADAQRQGAEGAVGGGVRVAADHGHARLGEAQLRADDVDDPLLGVAQGVQADAELLAVVAQGLDLGAAGEIGNRLVDVQRGGVVVLGGDGEVRAAQRAAGQPEALEGLRRGHLVDQVEVDEEKVGLGVGSFAFALAHHVRVPDFLGQCLCHGLLPSLRCTCLPACCLH